MSKLKIGVIGGGGIANAHLPRLSERKDAVELVALADVNPAAAATAEKWGIPKFVTDYRELLPSVDAVLICVPTHLHAPIAVDALNAGKHVFCEKPFARTMQQADNIADAAAKSGTAVQVGFVRRFDDEWLRWREAVQADKIGRPLVWRDLNGWFFNVAKWFTIEEQGGGPFIDGCVHNYDFGLYTFGPVQWVFAHLRTFRPSNTAFDTGTVTVHFVAGDELLLGWSWGLAENTQATRIFEFMGPKGTVTFPGAEAGASDANMVVNVGGNKELVKYPKDALTRAFASQMDEFIEVALGKKKPRAGIREGRESLAVALGVLESGRTSEKVNLSKGK